MKFIITQDQILKLQNNDSVKIIDVRPLEDYEQSHIQNSISIPEIFTHLPTGLTTKNEKKSFEDFFQKVLSKNGISKADTIVFYEEKYTLKSPRGITILKYLGHDEDKLFVLEGGFEYWKDNNLELTTKIPNITESNYNLDILENFFIDYDEMIDAMNDESIIKLDVRDKDEWIGISSSPYGLDFAPKKGRIPNSIWIEWYKFISDDLLKVESLNFIKAELQSQNIKTTDNIILYCFKGARISNSYIALRALGYENIKFYFAGWNEWCRLDGAPIINEVLEVDNPILKENIAVKKRLEEVCIANSKLIHFPKYNTEPIFAFTRKGDVYNDNMATKKILPSLHKLNDLIDNIDDDFIHNFIDNNQSDTIVREENNKVYEIHLKGSREVNAILAYGFDITQLKKLNENLEDIVEQRTLSLEKKTKYIEDNIRYAALIQEAILPPYTIFENSFKEHFIYWKPCDVVGGDIYFANTFGKENEEVVVMLLDGAGHSISGSFLTMLLKAIETKIVSKIITKKIEPEPHIILERLNHDFKFMTSQNKDIKALIGFDGGVLYYNKKTNICKYSGGKTPLYIYNDGELEIVKSDRISLGYPRNKLDQKFTQYEINIKKDTIIYMLTDGIIDQENENGEYYGKKSFRNFIANNHTKPLDEQKELLIDELNEFGKNIPQTDDITIIAIKF